MKKIKKLLLIMFILMNFILVSNCILADEADDIKEPNTSIDTILQQGSNFIKEGSISDESDFGGILMGIVGGRGEGGLLDGIFLIGNAAFMCIAVVLGIKYVFSSIEGKASIKESLVPYCIGAIFFYLPQTIFNFAKQILANFAVTTSLDNITSVIWGSISSIGNICAIGAIIIMGLKYMLTSADEKAQLKEKMIPLIIGIAMIYSTFTIIGFIVSVGSGIFNGVK